MNLIKERRAIDAALDNYRDWLDTIPDEQFTLTPPMGGWSYAEVYAHLLKANLGCGVAIDKCSNKTCEPTSKGLNLLGVLLLGFARFPPFKIKAPKSVEAALPATKISKEEARNMLIKSRNQLDKVFPLIEDALPNYRMKHPRMGMLTASQWLKFIRIHSLHHLKQLQRIKNNFSEK